MKKMLDYTESIKSYIDETEAKLTPIEDFTWETALDVANIIVFVNTGERLNDRETVVFYAAWNDYTYELMASITGFRVDYLCKSIGCPLWNKLSRALREKVSKKNFKAALKREWQRYTQAVLGSSWNRLTKPMTIDDVALIEGLLVLGSTFYLERLPIEKICRETIRQPGSLIRIEGARWMGKTSLIKQILEQVKLEGQRTVYLDFSNVNRNINRDALLRWLFMNICFQLDLKKTVQHHYQKSVLDGNDNCTAFFEEYILNEAESDIILALDNIDSLFSNQETTEKLLKLLSKWHEKGQAKGCWSKLKLMLTQSMNASIPPSLDGSLLDMGTPIILEKLSFKQVKTLASFYQLDWDELRIWRLFKEMKGNPFKVRLAMCRAKL